MSKVTPSPCAHNHLLPCPCGATINSIVPPTVELVDTRDIAKARLKTIRDESPPTLMATKFPGLH